MVAVPGWDPFTAWLAGVALTLTVYVAVTPRPPDARKWLRRIRSDAALGAIISLVGVMLALLAVPAPWGWGIGVLVAVLGVAQFTKVTLPHLVPGS